MEQDNKFVGSCECRKASPIQDFHVRNINIDVVFPVLFRICLGRKTRERYDDIAVDDAEVDSLVPRSGD